MDTLLENLSEYILSLNTDSLPKDVSHEVKRRILDSMGCAYGAYDSAPSVIARTIGRGISSASPSTMFGSGEKTSCDLAAFANGIMIRYLDYNDTYLSLEPAHPSDNISSAIAAAEAVNADGGRLICAIALGYEIQCRLCDSASLRKMGWDHVGYISISSAALAAKLLDLDKGSVMNAISLAVVPNNPLRQTRVGELSMWKGCAAANSGRNGVFSAMMASHGMTGPKEVFEGEKGFFRQITGCPINLDFSSFGGRGGSYMILDTYIKYYPSEYHSQAAIEAALSLRKDVPVYDIEDISVSTYDACVDIIASDKEKWTPKTRETADHSLPYAIAASLCYGRITMEEFSDERINSPDVQALMKKVKVMRCEEHTRSYPSSFPCVISVTLRGGKEFTKRVDFPKGHPKNPLDDSEVIKKFKTLSGPYITSSKQEEIIDRVFNLEGEKDIGKFMNIFKVQKGYEKKI